MENSIAECVEQRSGPQQVRTVAAGVQAESWQGKVVVDVRQVDLGAAGEAASKATPQRAGAPLRLTDKAASQASGCFLHNHQPGR